MRILGIETSCDDCAAAVLEDGNRILSHVVHSQIDTHRPYGGVVPELASRNHLEKIVPVIRAAMEKACVGFESLDGIAVTRGPGLVGSLLVGLCAAKALSFALGIPLCGVNHLEGHLVAPFLEGNQPSFPLLGLVVSGGHTSLYQASGLDDYRLLGETRDDAAGEAFDKVAKLLGLGYPGGVLIDKLAQEGNPRAFPFPRALSTSEGFDFSFSGLKTSVLYFVRRKGEAFAQDHLPDLAASFQEAVIDSLLAPLSRAVARTGIRTVTVSGGVACNSRLRSRLAEMAEAQNLRLHIPSPFLCTDNAAMIAAAGARRLARGERAPLSLNADPDLSL